MSSISCAGFGTDTSSSCWSYTPSNIAPRVASCSPGSYIPLQPTFNTSSSRPTSPSRRGTFPNASLLSYDTGISHKESPGSDACASHISGIPEYSNLHRVMVNARGTPTSLLVRQGTLISVSAPPARKAAELRTLLGSTQSRLRSGATYMPPPANASISPGISGPRSSPVALERAKVRAQVEVDLALAGDSFVQGQCIAGHFILRVRRDPKNKDESPVLLADAKLRVVGFECLADEQHSHIFFQYTCRLDEISYSSEQLFEGPAEDGDGEGYRRSQPGLHVLPFEMELPVEVPGGNAKGGIEVHGSIAIRYVAIASIKVKDACTSKRSLAHFYRSCTIWPLLSFLSFLVPAPRPLISTGVRSLFLGYRHPCNKLKLTARLARLWYLSGQRCYVLLHVENHTVGVVRSAMVTLVRTTTVYKPADGGEPSDGSTHQTHTYSRDVAENRLDVGERGTKGHASAKGWWTGVGTDQAMEFLHYVQLPPDALSVSRSKLLAVDYGLRVTVSASTVPGLSSDLSVILPIRIASMVSVDPPPSSTIPSEALVISQYTKASDAPHYVGNGTGTLPPYRTRPPSLERPESYEFPDILDLKPPYYTPHAPNAALPSSDRAGDVKPGIALLVANPSTPSTVATSKTDKTKLRNMQCEPPMSPGLHDTDVHGQSTRNDEDVFLNQAVTTAACSEVHVEYISNTTPFTASSAFLNANRYDEDGRSGFDGGAGHRVVTGHLNRSDIRMSPLSLHRTRARALEMPTRRELDIEDREMDGHLTFMCVEDTASGRVPNRRSELPALQNESSFARRVREKLTRIVTDRTSLGVILPEESSPTEGAPSDSEADKLSAPWEAIPDAAVSHRDGVGADNSPRGAKTILPHANESDGRLAQADLDLFPASEDPGCNEIHLDARKLQMTRPQGGRPFPMSSASRSRHRPHTLTGLRTPGSESTSSPFSDAMKAYLHSRDPTPKTPRLEVQMLRRPKMASSRPGSVMDRVMMLEEKVRALE